MHTRIQQLLCFGFIFLAGPISGQELTGEMLDAIHEKLSREIEDNFFAPDSLVAAEEEVWGDYFRTSELEGEDAIGFSPGLTPPQGVRIGSICMDGTRTDERGRGACGGYGGVRFWIYQINEDSVAYFPTDRHRRHPEPLSVREVNNLSSRNAVAADPPAKRSWSSYRFEDVLIAMMACVTIAYVARLWFNRDA